VIGVFTEMGRKRKVKDDNDDKGRQYFPWTNELDQILVALMMSLVESKVDANGNVVYWSGVFLFFVFQTHPHCAKMNKIPFPCYDALDFVFGKARATVQGRLHEAEEFVGVDDDVNPATPTDKTHQYDATSRPKRVRRSTRRENASDETDELRPILKHAVDSLQSLAGQTNDTNNRKDNLYKDVAKIEGISEEHVVDAPFEFVKDGTWHT
ncbi:hypothetical protein LINGRAHAP2_LOCUS24031, partial [Linum grandiflorum]